jgi:hypothetical protein
MIGKFGGKRIGVWCIDKGVPPHGRVTLGFRQRRRSVCHLLGPPLYTSELVLSGFHGCRGRIICRLSFPTGCGKSAFSQPR